MQAREMPAASYQVLASGMILVVVEGSINVQAVRMTSFVASMQAGHKECISLRNSCNTLMACQVTGGGIISNIQGNLMLSNPAFIFDVEKLRAHADRMFHLPPGDVGPHASLLLQCDDRHGAAARQPLKGAHIQVVAAP